MKTKTGKKGVRISAVILAKNEEKNILDCLKSLNWVEEIILVDGNSKDKTCLIGKKFGAKIFEIETSDFSERRNFGTDKVKGDWVLHIDADERVTEGLKQEILDIVLSDKQEFTQYAIPRCNFVFGKKMTHCGLWPDYVIRLFRKKYFVSWKGKLHETANVKGNLGYMNNYFVHMKHDNLFDIVVKTNEWSAIEAKLMFEANHPPMNMLRFFSSMLREFYLRMIRQLAFLDGVEGVIYGIYQVWSRFLSYAKLWELQGVGVNTR